MNSNMVKDEIRNTLRLIKVDEDRKKLVNKIISALPELNAYDFQTICQSVGKVIYSKNCKPRLVRIETREEFTKEIIITIPDLTLNVLIIICNFIDSVVYEKTVKK